MRYGVDLALFNRKAHNPSFFSLVRSMDSAPGELVDFCVPCNQYFPTPRMFAELGSSLQSVLKYYPSDSEAIARRLADTLGQDPKTIVLANGSTELIRWIDALFVKGSLATPIPTFGRWTDQPVESGKGVHHYQTRPESGFRLDADDFARFVIRSGASVAVVCNPNNPDSSYVPKEEMLALIDRLSGLDLVVIDESFIDFVEAEASPSVESSILDRENVIVLKSLGKCFGLHGVRLGYAVCNSRLAARLRQMLPPWNINALAEAIIFSLKDNLDAYQQSLARIAQDRRAMNQRLARLEGLTVFPSQANFILVRLPAHANGTACRNHLLTEHGVFVRECGNKLGIDNQHLRLAVRKPEEVTRLIVGLADFLANGRLRTTPQQVVGVVH